MESDIFNKINKAEPEPPPRVYFWRRLLVYCLFVPALIMFGFYANGLDYKFTFSVASFYGWGTIFLGVLFIVIIISLFELIHLKLWQAKKRRHLSRLDGES